MIHSEMCTLRRQNEALKNEILLLKLSNSAHLKNVNTSMRRIASFPVARGFCRNDDSTSGEANEVANAAPTITNGVLSKNPKTLHNGLSGNSALVVIRLQRSLMPLRGGM